MWTFPYIVLVALNLLDYWATNILVGREGFSVEANPILYAWITSANSTTPILVAKIIPVVCIGIILVYFRHGLLHRAKLIRNVLWGLNAVTGVVCVIGALLLHSVSL